MKRVGMGIDKIFTITIPFLILFNNLILYIDSPIDSYFFKKENTQVD